MTSDEVRRFLSDCGRKGGSTRTPARLAAIAKARAVRLAKIAARKAQGVDSEK